MLRTRWAAIGAAVAVTLGAGGLTLVDAAQNSGERPVTILLDAPCRLVDTRPDRGIGGRTTPIGPAEAHTVQGTGPSGNCNIPANAVGLVTNVTADQATQTTNLRLYPTGAPVPTTSNLNPRPGAAPTPNAVTVGLNGGGQFDVRNAKGSVHVIIDVSAYLVDHTHDDRYYTEDEVNALLKPYYVLVSDIGEIYEGYSSGVLSTERISEGTYTITFDTDVEGRKCIALATDALFFGSRVIKADPTGGANNVVNVRVRDTGTGLLVDTFFNIALVCDPTN